MTVQAFDADQVVSKGEFARLIGVSAPRVSQYIGERKLFGEALVGEGRSARIRVSAAKAQLRRFIDISQRFGNGLDTRLDDAPAPPVPSAPVIAAVEPALPLPAPDDTIEGQIKQEKLEQLRRANRKLAEDEAARAGRYVLADDVVKEMGRALGQQLSGIEGWLSDLATKFAAKFNISQRDALHMARTEFRDWRERQSAALQEQAQALPQLVEDEVAALDDDLVEA